MQNIVAALSELILDTDVLKPFVHVWGPDKQIARVFAGDLPDKLVDLSTNKLTSFEDSKHLPAITIMTMGARSHDLRVYQNIIYSVFVWERTFSGANEYAELLKRAIHARKGNLNDTRYAAIQYTGGDKDLKDSTANRVCRHFEISTVIVT